MKKQGFTLIELLAVIVVLAIIALITIPLILGVVERARKGAAINSAYGFIDAVEKQTMINQMNENPDIIDGTYNDLDELKNTYKVKVKGTEPKQLELTITKGKVDSATFTFGKYEVVCEQGKCSIGKTNEVSVVDEDILEPIEVELQDENGNVIATWNDLKQYNLNIQKNYTWSNYNIDNGKKGNSLAYVIATYYSEYQNIKAIIKNGAEHIGNYVLRDCTNIASITIPNSVTSIGDYAFYYCANLTSITIPNSVTSIGDYAFGNCRNLTSITIPNSVTSIGNSVFYYCTNLTNVTIPNSVTSIGINIDYGCTNLSYNEYDNAYYLGNSENPYLILIKAKATNIATVNINENTRFIRNSAFSGCTSLTNITIPNSVTNIGYYAFSTCTNLTNVTFGNMSKLKIIDESAFSSCRNLTSIEIPSSVTSIGKSAFSGCTSLTNITIPSSVTSIGDYAFMNCTGLTSIEIPSSVTSIGSRIFANCENNLAHNEYDNAYYIGNSENPYLILIKAKAKNITTVSINENTKFIYDYAFSRCTSLASMTIPSGVISIGDYVLNESGLTNITVDSANANYSSQDGILFDKNKTTLIAYPPGKTSTSYTIPSSVKNIGTGAFMNCTKLTSIEIPSNVTSIEQAAFNGCTNLETVTFKNGSKLTDIGPQAFDRCTKLTSITIPKSVTTIVDYAFSGCTNLETVTFENGSRLTDIRSQAFAGCAKLTSITIPASVTSIGSSVFSGCTNLTSVTFENTTGWTIGSNSIDVTNPTTNATNLTSTYKSNIWKRN